MIKIGRLEVSWLMVPFLVVVYFTGSAVSTCIAYAVVFMHELAHIMAAKKYGVKVGAFVVMPFGVNMRLKDNVIKNLAHEINICLAGPCMNFILLILGLVAKYNWLESSGHLDFFFTLKFFYNAYKRSSHPSARRREDTKGRTYTAFRVYKGI